MNYMQHFDVFSVFKSMKYFIIYIRYVVVFLKFVVIQIVIFLLFHGDMTCDRIF